ncbi:MAG: hypothetical protein D6681_22930 [Calditrichaeota bacterium]|nr:MAG: hypothetical protein D6681_22930 [Calditrichota bacterium]
MAAATEATIRPGGCRTIERISTISVKIPKFKEQGNQRQGESVPHLYVVIVTDKSLDQFNLRIPKKDDKNLTFRNRVGILNFVHL